MLDYVILKKIRSAYVTMVYPNGMIESIYLIHMIPRNEKRYDILNILIYF